MTSPADADLLQAFSERIAAQMGLSFPRERWPELLRGMDTLARDSGLPSAQACMQQWLAAPVQRTQIERLARYLSVGETYFFREPSAFEVLEQHVLPPLIAARRAGGKCLRLWSAGCCTGEEAYTLAILLARLIPDLQDWDVTILGTDINPSFLMRAQQGVYRDWSFRGVPSWIKQRYFDHLGQGRHAVRAELKRIVKFEYFNLAEQDGLMPCQVPMDLVLCRHVLMYFDAVKAQQALQVLRRALADDGWLLTSAAEAAPLPYEGFAAVRFEGALLHRRHADRPAPVLAGASTASRTVPEVPPSTREQRAHAWQRGAAGAEGASAPAALARLHADQGRLDEALHWCEIAIAVDRTDAALHYLHALISEERGQLEGAKAALRRAVYLDPGFVLARFALGRLCERQGDARGAGRHFAQALRLLGPEASATVLRGADGLSARRLGEVLQAKLA